MTHLQSVKLILGELFTEKGSDYNTYVQKVRSTADVNNGYLKTRFIHGSATHISSAYRLTNPLGPFDQDSIDNHEIEQEEPS